MYQGILAALFTALSIFASPANRPDSVLPKLLDAAVMVEGSKDSGSGVGFRNGDHGFVWTNGHVVQALRTIKTAIDPKTGVSKTYVAFEDVWCLQDTSSNGRITGHVKKSAKVIRFNMKEDIALLKIYETAWPPKGAKFVNRIPQAGSTLWHIGSPGGEQNINTPLPGTYLKAGRVLNDVIWDQVSTPAFWGCSGGGVYLKKNGECVGLLTRFADHYRGQFTHGNMYIVPARRIQEFAKRVKVEFAVDSSVPVPTDDVIMQEPIGDEPIEVTPVVPNGNVWPFRFPF